MKTHIRCIAVSGSTIFAATQEGVFLSTNNGASWAAADSGLPEGLDINALVVSGSNIFAGRNDGVYLSTNNGTSWTAVNSGLPANIHFTSFIVSGSSLFAGTSVDGVWRRSLSEMTGVVDNPFVRTSLPANFKIRLPGNTSSSATIRFSLPRSEKVTVSVYNLVGHEIATLLNCTCASGSHSVMWDTRAVAAGRYAVRMQIGGQSYLRSVSIVR
jgi:hypothetical protein